ncbi:MAG: ClpXP protease specificity-enhancing factor [SAR86 cluster bacterium]|uniref:ClpXP protease specificity-enhancing factor n=1 Tax=SAR86 cluster bacterium TaxID=2030880 RepID=A0A2A4MRR8_9GAMM|nr:MAG: ClpXP protease specificity-enhancing factor [SAR86 cluster bacterium]
MSMTSSRPYIIRALYEWIVENDCTPYLLVNAFEESVQVPQEHVKDGQIVLNISPTAVQDFLIDNQALEFNGRFAGIPTRVYVPVSAVLGIYAKENGQGMRFEPGESLPEPPTPDGGGEPRMVTSQTASKTKSASTVKKIRPSLRVVK